MSVQIYRPALVEALQFKGENINECIIFCPELSVIYNTGKLMFSVGSFAHTLDAGDWIIKQRNGQFCFCREKHFGILYESEPRTKPNNERNRL